MLIVGYVVARLAADPAVCQGSTEAFERGRGGIVGADDFAAVLAALGDPSFSFVDALSIAA